MATPRKRTRNRMPDLTPAQRQWLTGEPQKDANKFELIDLEHAARSRESLESRARLIEENKSSLAPERLRFLLKQQRADEVQRNELEGTS